MNNGTHFLRETYKCEKCLDMGVVIEKRKVPELYGDAPIEFAVPCPVCKGKKVHSGDTTGIPGMYYDADISKFDFSRYKEDISKIKAIANDFVLNFDKWMVSGKGLYLWSKTPGSGKTFLAASIAKSVMIKHNLKMQFVTHADYITKRMENIERQKQYLPDLTIAYRDCDLLVLDDLGTAKKGGYQEQCLFELINYRLTNGLTTIITSNALVTDIALDDRIRSRIEKAHLVIHFPEESIRQQIAEDENRQFLDGILGVGNYGK